MDFDFSPYARGGAAARPDSFSGLTDPFSQALAAMLSDAPANVQLGVKSAFRSPEVQARLWEEALAKYGSPEAARKWVAPPGKSQHNHGNAADLEYMSPEALEWVHANAGNYGLSFPLSNEDWHIELATARNGAPQPQPAVNALGATSGQGSALPAVPNAQPSPGTATTSPIQTRAAPQWVGMIAPPQLSFQPLTLPSRRSA